MIPFKRELRQAKKLHKKLLKYAYNSESKYYCNNHAVNICRDLEQVIYNLNQLI